MLTGIDHLVIVVPDLDQAHRNYQALGFTVVPGGRHPTGSHNALIALADGAYLELIAFYQPSPAHKWWEPLHKGGGLVDYCLQTDDLRHDTAALRRAGVPIDDPSPLSRVRPDGYELRWVLSIPRPPYRGVAPFLIEDETPRRERIPGETRHANGATGIGTLTIAVADPERPARWFADVLGKPAARVVSEELGAIGRRVVVGPHTIDFLAPDASGSPLRAWLAARGDAPYAATLRSATATGGLLDEAKTLGARLSLV
jgi:catechol 2,3-dioxygenase-like lactoylglutathione lyase family enzyme